MFTASYDSVGNRIAVAELGGSFVYAYDGSRQLVAEHRTGTSACSCTFSYDGVGNRLTSTAQDGAVTSYSYNPAHELLTTQALGAAPTTFGYDAAGNTVREVGPSADVTYTWDGENRLTQVNAAGSMETYTYDASGLRRKKTAGGSTTNFVWDRVNLLSELDGNLASIAQYTDFPGVWGGLASQRRGGTSTFFDTDLSGATRALSDAAGSVSDRYVYRANGAQVAQTGSTTNPLRPWGRAGFYRDGADRLMMNGAAWRPSLDELLNMFGPCMALQMLSMQQTVGGVAIEPLPGEDPGLECWLVPADLAAQLFGRPTTARRADGRIKVCCGTVSVVIPFPGPIQGPTPPRPKPGPPGGPVPPSSRPPLPGPPTGPVVVWPPPGTPFPVENGMLLPCDIEGLGEADEWIDDSDMLAGFVEWICSRSSKKLCQKLRDLLATPTGQIADIALSIVDYIDDAIEAYCSCRKLPCNRCCCTRLECYEPCGLALTAAVASYFEVLGSVLDWPIEYIFALEALSFLTGHLAETSFQHNTKKGCYDLSRRC